MNKDIKNSIMEVCVTTLAVALTVWSIAIVFKAILIMF